MSNFPKMGDSATRDWSARSADTSGELTTPRKGPTGLVQDVLNGHRSQSLEPLGHVGGVKATYCYPNSTEAGATGRSVYILPSAVGNRDFWDKRRYGQGQDL
jgi:hypothetical protein